MGGPGNTPSMVSIRSRHKGDFSKRLLYILGGHFLKGQLIDIQSHPFCNVTAQTIAPAKTLKSI